ncbi:transmembrane secretion effector [Tumebacillus sp. BK434]|uniref:MFS transporter n=1 Tax=Tumebacillus sp. BK434 TaxID=2512169 RepID=UPI0010D3D573|nr:MFS transporter [Tumebacillus sp. BK434]TCP59034.1 transmembrane secretion effector [Tumebacillus sp. BK434]
MSTPLAGATPAAKPKSLWRNRQFLYLWVGTLFSGLTFHIYTLGLPLMIYDLSHSTLAMSSMAVMNMLPYVLFGMLAGVIVDRLDRKRVMLTAVAMQVAILLLLFTLLSTGVAHVWVLYVLGFCLTTFGYLFSNASTSIVPLLMEREQYVSANATINFWGTVISSLGPAIAGSMLVVMNYRYGILITVGGFLMLFFFTSLMKVPVAEKPKELSERKTTIREEMKEGWQQLLLTRELFMITILVLAVNFVTSFAGAVIVFYALDKLHLASSSLGLVLSASALGSLSSTFVAKPSLKWGRRGKLLVGAVLTAALGQSVLFFSSHWLVLAAGLFILGASSTFSNVHIHTIRQEVTPNHMLGRVAGTTSMLARVAAPIGLFLGGLCGEYIEVHYIFLTAALMYLSLALLSMKNKLQDIV